MPTLATIDATWVNDASVTWDAGEARRADAAMFAQGGIAKGLDVSVDASDNVTVQPGSFVIDGDDYASGTGVYRGGLAAAATVLLDTRDATNPRVDLVVARQYDADVHGSHATYGAAVEVLTGTPAASPTPPALPDLAVELARIDVPASGGAAASVDSSQRVSAEPIGLPDPPNRQVKTSFEAIDGSGEVVISHSLGVVPDFAMAWPGSSAVFVCSLVSKGSTSCRFKVYGLDGILVTSTNRTFQTLFEA